MVVAGTPNAVLETSMSGQDQNERRNEHDQAIGAPIEFWSAPAVPPHAVLTGRWCVLESLDVQRHGADLYRAVKHDSSARNWTYLAYGPFADESSYLDWVRSVCDGEDPMFHAIIDVSSGAAVGVGSYLRIDPANGCIDVGHLHFSPLM